MSLYAFNAQVQYLRRREAKLAALCEYAQAAAARDEAAALELIDEENQRVEAARRQAVERGALKERQAKEGAGAEARIDALRVETLQRQQEELDVMLKRFVGTKLLNVFSMCVCGGRGLAGGAGRHDEEINQSNITCHGSFRVFFGGGGASDGAVSSRRSWML